MMHFFSVWNSGANHPSKPTNQVSRFLLDINETFKTFLTSSGWMVYLIAGILMVSCVYYYLSDWRRRTELRRRRQEVQRASERITQRRRPGAVYRDHEIFRNALKIVRQYIGRTNEKNNKQFLLRRTRSGAIYGRFSEHDN